jgi:hypothetical protein
MWQAVRNFRQSAWNDNAVAKQAVRPRIIPTAYMTVFTSRRGTHRELSCAAAAAARIGPCQDAGRTSGMTLPPAAASPGKSSCSTFAASSAIVKGFFRTRCSEGSSFVGPT